MTQSEIEELILDLVGPRSASPFEIAEEICDVVPSNMVRTYIVQMVLDRKLIMDCDLNVSLPSPTRY